MVGSVTILAARHTTMIHLAARLPTAATCSASPTTTTVRWMHQAGTDWTRYAAELAQDHDPQL